MKISFISLFLLFFSLNLISQTSFVVIDSINIEGNNKTKSYIITNELDISIGDTIFFNDLGPRFLKNKNRVLSTGLFVDASFNLKSINITTGNSTMLITVIESWYIYPKIIFELVDRNFNEWYYDHNASFKRINLGLELEHKNLTGDSDFLEVKLQAGITRKVELKYIRPYLSKSHRIGLIFNILYKNSKELAYDTRKNKLEYFRDDNKTLFNQFRINTGLTYKPELFDIHSVNFKFFNNEVNPIILDEYNSNFFTNNPKQRYFNISYSYVRDTRQYKLYPRGGYLLGFSVEKIGLGIFKDINQLDISSTFEKYFSFKNFISSYQIKGKKRIFSKENPYFNNKSLGYEDDFLNGYELYVIDGENYIFSKTSQKFRILSGTLDFSPKIRIKQFKFIPYDFYLSLNFDMGYVNNNVNFVENNFNNRLLYGYGIGLDIIVYNNLFRISYSFNHIGEGGLFLYFSYGK